MVEKTSTKQTIVNTAATLFHTHSYAGVGVANICSVAGVSKGSFFHYFKSKRELAVAVMDEFQERINNTLVAKAFTTNLPPLERLDRFILELYKFHKEQSEITGHFSGCPLGNLAMEQATQDEVLRKKTDLCLRDLAKSFLTVVSDAVEEEELPPLDQDATADAMLSYIEGIQLLAKTRNDPELIIKLGPAIKLIHIANKP